MRTTFWLSVVGVLYPYLGYPLLLWLVGRLAPTRARGPIPDSLPTVSMIIPVHNEETRVAKKVANTASLRYPADRLQILFVSDGSTDRTVEIIRGSMTPSMTLLDLPNRGGKAIALNAGLAAATNDILVFSDASIELEPDSLRHLVSQFQDPRIGCVSGEDRIAESGGEAMYGRYELMLRTLESRVHSIAGASGSFYAQRRALCQPFVEGMAPDFLSVLRTVEQGYRATSEPAAVGSMVSVRDPRHEFQRKVRTLIRGMTTLFSHAGLLNPMRYGSFAFILISHKLLRWLAPVFLIGVLLIPLTIWDSPLYMAAFALQVFFYLGAAAALWQWGGVHRSTFGKVALYFSSVNMAILSAWLQFGRGVRLELWTPSHR